MEFNCVPNQLALLMCLVAGVMTTAAALAPGADWYPAHATFYGGANGNDGTMGGACGYGDMLAQGFGLQTAALSTPLFNGGHTCGACYELQCYNDPQWCMPGSVVVTATNECPPNWNIPSDNGGWCNPPREHFDLSMPAYLEIGTYVAGIVPVLYRRVPCQKQGGVRFLVKGNPYFQMVLVYNVGCAGDVTGLLVKGSSTAWLPTLRNWGQNWQFAGNLLGQSLSFAVTTSDGATSTSYNASPTNWGYGQTFEGSQFTCSWNKLECLIQLPVAARVRMRRFANSTFTDPESL